jgi:putative phage-type endonuclease
MTVVGEGVGAPAPAGGYDTGAPADRTQWLEERRQGVGGSDVAAIVGLAPPSWGSAWSIWATKVGLLPIVDEPSEAMQLGTDLEPVIATWFHRQTHLWVHGEQTKIVAPGDPWAFCHVDGFVLEPGTDDIELALGIFEAKYDGSAPWDEIPVHYQCQVQWSLWCAGMERAWVAVMHLPFGRPRFRVYEVERNETDIALIVERCRAFWHDHVLTGEPPAVDGSEATARALAAVYPHHEPGERVALDDLADVLTERAELKATEAETRKRLKELDNQVVAAFGTAEVGTVDGEAVLTYRTTVRKGYWVADGEYRALRAASKKDREAA